jgi:hypothetical protein
VPHLGGGLLKKADQMANPTKEQITLRAYEIWEKNGNPSGRDLEFYEQAEKELNAGATEDEKSETFLE